jgi:hypothetical protein
MNEKIREADLLKRLEPGAVLLAPVVVRKMTMEPGRQAVDARIDIGWPRCDEAFPFVVEVKTQSTPAIIRSAIANARAAARRDERIMIMVPYMSPERLDELERDGVSGIDLCGNGVVVVPGRLCILRSGHPNLYPDSRPLNNPYRGRSALVARTLLTSSFWPTLSAMVESMHGHGAGISMAQASKAVRALEDDLIVTKAAGAIKLQEPARLLDKLGAAWRPPTVRGRRTLKLATNAKAAWARQLSADSDLQWAVTGESSATHSITFAQGGPRRIAVSDLSRATAALVGATSETVPNFADLELLETEEPGFFYGATPDAHGIRWASHLQTWIELQAGDARQRDAARDLRPLILERVGV